ncbi:MAG: glycoside hydrolase family 9 protein, partial [Xanthomonadales bacterium]|nr:glycoside hydrolase family 9 protein [Xanthomonadales bacterium]
MESTRFALKSVLLLLIATIWSSVAVGQVNHQIKVDHFGYRPGDLKLAIVSANPGASVQLRDTSNTVVYTIPADGGSITSMGNDGLPSGDDVWWVDFSAFSTPGTYHVYSPTLSGQSYDFEIRENIYNEVVRTAMRTFYLQRCNTEKTTEFAGDWADPAQCHMTDVLTEQASGHTDHGDFDLTGGWHDAGDYNKYVWRAVSTAVVPLLRAHADNPGVFHDGDLNIPESGNGVPDVLDEIRYELDWMLKMQLPDGSVLHQMHVPGFAWDSPPSADTNVRYYHDPNNESAAVFAGTLAHASRVFDSIGETAYAATLESAALDAWAWLEPRAADPDAAIHEVKAWAAAEIFATDNTQTSARTFVDNFYPGQWSGTYFNPTRYDSHAAITYIQTPGATAAVVANMRSAMSAQVNDIFSNNDLYRNGMPSWAYHWGSNTPRANYGLFLLIADKLGERGSYTSADLREHALDFLHFFHGQNAINMLYLSNMHALGGEHSSWQFYHGWFGNSGDPDSTSNFFGKPTGIIEPDYPYFKGTDNHGIGDNKSSTYGPAPGFVPGGPNAGYSGDAVPPGSAGNYNRYYRDWADQAVWTVQSWEITESSIGYQGPYVALGAHFMEPNVAPVAAFTYADTGLSVSYSDTSTDSDGGIV